MIAPELDRRRPTDHYTDRDLAELRPHVLRCDPADATDPKVYLTPAGFGMLRDYTRSEPTGHCDGKVWKVQGFHYEPSDACRVEGGCPGDPSRCHEHAARPKYVKHVDEWYMREFVEDETVWRVVRRRIVVR